MRKKNPPLASSQSDVNSAYHKIRRYFRRLVKFEQMDFQFAFWQMFYLLAAPKKLTKVFKARKNFKSQFARDDPAFLILFAGALCLTSIGFAIVLGYTFIQFLKFLVVEIFIDCIGIGVVIATFLWYISNTFLKPKTMPQDVEWGFAFDIHLNAFFPPLIILHFILLIYYNLFLRHPVNNALGALAVVFGNLIWLIASIYYIYITFLGYSSMRILNNTKFFLMPIPLLVFVYFCSLLQGFDISSVVFNMYRQRVI